ncbi:MAG: succinate dehydrogenase, hydrophobic membrane anchor protein [Alphaproteobacteria bacterium]|uniref:Succinate dehydrogenase hydrophobic membrane anchor subunit n=1 Tax=Candidatus Nitrobium versatile TaxID=2884831 RepID=A0A953M112_9BACT|nr:succinate dehydrogenase, hydrophobic membrane anchor protein [Candidatus Nitrobium versatile]
MKGVVGWLLQRVTGVLLVAGLAVHFLVMHFSGPEKITHAVVLERISTPWWKTFDVVFLTSVIYHGFYGMWGLAEEYIRPEGLRRAAKAALLLMAAVLYAVGIYIVTLS